MKLSTLFLLQNQQRHKYRQFPYNDHLLFLLHADPDLLDFQHNQNQEVLTSSGSLGRLSLFSSSFLMPYLNSFAAASSSLLKTSSVK